MVECKRIGEYQDDVLMRFNRLARAHTRIRGGCAPHAKETTVAESACLVLFDPLEVSHARLLLDDVLHVAVYERLSRRTGQDHQGRKRRTQYDVVVGIECESCECEAAEGWITAEARMHVQEESAYVTVVQI